MWNTGASVTSLLVKVMSQVQKSVYFHHIKYIYICFLTCVYYGNILRGFIQFDCLVVDRIFFYVLAVFFKLRV